MSYLVLRKHYGRYMTSEGPDQLAKMKVSTRDVGGREAETAATTAASA